MVNHGPFKAELTPRQNTADTRRLLAELNNAASSLGAAARGFFAVGAPIVVSRAPGRLDVMGGIADYSGSLVLEMPLAEATFALVQASSEPVFEARSVSNTGSTYEPLKLELSEIGKTLGNYQAARSFLSQPERRWAAYVIGCFLALVYEGYVEPQHGIRMLIYSRVPEGKGVSSSAALEVAAMMALCRLLKIELEPLQLALLCQKVENLIAGAPCGVMDQVTVALGKANCLLALRCQPAVLEGHVSVPEEICFWGIDSGIAHSVSGADYGSVRTGAFMGYTMIAKAAGLPIRAADRPGHVLVEDNRWGGYLANIDPGEFEREFVALLPVKMSGQQFLAQYGGTPDLVTTVDPQRQYAVRRPTAHPVYENSRVQRFAQLLRLPPDEVSLRDLGELMLQSHASYSACGLGSDGTDRLVELVRLRGPQQGLYGAKITGGGCGGTVAVLGRRHAESVVKEIAHQYAKETGYEPRIFAGSSCGAAEFGTFVLSFDSC